MAERMRVSLGQTVLVENVPGAAGSIGIGRVARASPEGYTIAVGQWGTHVINSVIYKLPYDVLGDFEPIGLVADSPFLIVAKRTLPPNDLRELIDWLKANPDRVSQGTRGSGRRVACRRYIVPVEDRHTISVCPLPRSGPRNARLGCRADRHDDRYSSQFTPSGAGRPN
jgi:hypothetical protein